MHRLLINLALIAALSLAGLAVAQPVTPTAPAGPSLTPVQSAWLRAEIKRADTLFVKRVVAITDLPQDTVRQSIPAEGRITDPVARTVSALEKFSGKTLNDEQKTAIRAAEEDRRQMIAGARARVHSK